MEPFKGGLGGPCACHLSYFYSAGSKNEFYPLRDSQRPGIIPLNGSNSLEWVKFEGGNVNLVLNYIRKLVRKSALANGRCSVPVEVPCNG